MGNKLGTCWVEVKNETDQVWTYNLRYNFNDSYCGSEGIGRIEPGDSVHVDHWGLPMAWLYLKQGECDGKSELSKHDPKVIKRDYCAGDYPVFTIMEEGKKSKQYRVRCDKGGHFPVISKSSPGSNTDHVDNLKRQPSREMQESETRRQGYFTERHMSQIIAIVITIIGVIFTALVRNAMDSKTKA